jgi:hypothetical protein
MRILPAIVAVALQMPLSHMDAGPGSTLTLESTPQLVPFKEADQLLIDRDQSEESNPEIVVIIQVNRWPWVLVRFEGAAQWEVTWIDFTTVRNARRIGHLFLASDPR